MKNKKQLFIIGGVVAALIIAIILCAVLISNRDSAADDNPKDTTGTSQEVTIDEPKGEEPKVDEIDDPTTEDKKGDETTGDLPDGTVVITPDEDPDNSGGTEQTGEKADDPEKPVDPKPTPEEPETTGGITIGGEPPAAYNCGVAGHHCDGPETHAYVTNLELQGCPYCGKHDCPSFYATDKWGNTCYTPSKCPNYEAKKDPAQYCQDCGKKLGDGRNGTCVQFVMADDCPNCKEHVDAWTCHSCK